MLFHINLQEELSVLLLNHYVHTGALSLVFYDAGLS